MDAVVRLAAETGTGQSMHEMRPYMDTNVTGTVVLLEARVQRRIDKIVLSSSRAMYAEGMWECANCGPVHPSLPPSDSGQTPDWAPLCPECETPVAGLLPTPEDAPMDPVSVYGISKLAQELLVSGVQKAYPADVSILRFFLDWAASQPHGDRYEQSPSEIRERGLYR